MKQRLEVQGAILAKGHHNVYKGFSFSSISFFFLSFFFFFFSFFFFFKKKIQKINQLGTYDAFHKIVTREGIKNGLWTGFSVTLLRDIPFALSYFTTYEYCKIIQNRMAEQFQIKYIKEGTVPNHLLAGAGAGIAASLVTIPIDVIKTRIQTETLTKNPKHPLSLANQESTGNQVIAKSKAVEIAKKIYKQEGWRGFYKGLAPRLISIIPSASITFASYEFYKKVLGV